MYGNSIFSSFKAKDISNTRDELLFISLDKIMWYRKILKVSCLNSNYVLVDGNGITLFKIFTDIGYFTGNDTTKYLYYRSRGDDHRLLNPIASMANDEKIIRKKIKKIPITKCLIITEGTHIGFPTDAKVINFSKLPYALSEGYLYSEKEIDKIEKKLELLSKSV